MDLLATSNPSSGKIIGATANSLTMGHELGHLEYNKRPLYARMSLAEEQYKTWCLVCLVGYIAIGGWMFKWGAIISIVNSLALHFYEEIWCWFYAFKLWKKQNTNQAETAKQ